MATFRLVIHAIEGPRASCCQAKCLRKCQLLYQVWHTVGFEPKLKPGPSLVVRYFFFRQLQMVHMREVASNQSQLYKMHPYSTQETEMYLLMMAAKVEMIL